MELVPYTEAQRDRVELELFDEKNKVNLMERLSGGMRTVMYHLMRENVTLIYVEDQRTNAAAEFEVPNEQAMEWYNHSFAHPDANLPRYNQGTNNE